MSKFQVGDRIHHILHGKGTVIYHEEGRPGFSVPVKFDSGYKKGRSWGFLASPEFLTKIEDLVQENE